MTDVGRKRQINQDYVFASPKPQGNMPNLFIVADGMGGHNAGDYASKYTVDTIVSDIKKSFEKNPTIIIKKAIQIANKGVRQKASEDTALYGMGTTVVVATIIGRYLQVANVGDSRLYIVSPDEIKQITKDHSLVEEILWQQKMPEAVIIPVSAKEQVGMKGVLDAILERLPEGEPFYPKDTLTDKTLRFFASEIIREKILLNYDKEIPYCCEIEIDTYKEEPTIDRISATIYVARQSQKGIVIGHKGERLKKVGQKAREDMERFLGKKVFLQLFVKVQEDWRNSERQLRRFGYDLQ